MTTEISNVWDTMVEYGIATSEEIGLVVALNGCRMDVLNDIIFVRTGYRTLEQYLDEGEDEE